jgi:hypothetical protein
LLPLKAAAREALIQQGRSTIPAVLQPASRARDYADRVARDAAGGERLRALQLIKGTGFGAKQINVAKAVLCTRSTQPIGTTAAW